MPVTAKQNIPLDPRTKLFLFLSTCVMAMNSTNNIFFLLLGSFLMLILTADGLGRDYRLRYGIYMGGIMISMLSGLLPENGLTIFILIIVTILRMFIPVIFAFALVFQTTTISEFMAAFEKMKLPSTFVIPFAVMFRFVPTVFEEWIAIRQAMSFRGIGTGWRTVVCHPLQTAEYMLVPLLISCVNVMDELAAATLARGLDSDKKRTCIAVVKCTCWDGFIILIQCIFIVSVLWQRGVILA
ncbi:MAG: energy-coupling factor transporter transmembrane component T [Eubacteriales bacterium]